MKVLDGVDATSFTFRYPVDKQGAKVSRPDFLDLDELNRYVEQLDTGVGALIDYLSENGLT